MIAALAKEPTVVAQVEGREVILKCPTQPSVNSDGYVWLWNRRYGPNSLQILARIQIEHSRVVYKHKTKSKDIRLGSLGGELTIRELVKNDTGMYECKLNESRILSSGLLNLIVKGKTRCKNVLIYT